MTPRQTSATTLLAAALAVAGCHSPADPHREPVTADTPLVAAVDDVQPRTGHTPDSGSGSRPDPDGHPRPPHPHATGDHADRRAVDQPVDADANPPSSDSDTGQPGTGAPNLAPPGERTLAFAHHTRPAPDDSAAPTSRHESPRAAAIDIIETGLAGQGLEVYAVTADLIEQAGATATVRVAALHRLNGPPRQSVYELDLEADAGVWTVVAHRPIQP